MIDVHIHLQKILDTVGPIDPIDVALADAVGCILAEDLISEHSLPAADAAAYDGYAVASAELAGADDEAVVLPVSHDLRSGEVAPALVPGTAMRLTSGTELPEGADAVVSIDDTDGGDARVTFSASVAPGTGVRPAALDVPAGVPVIEKGIRLEARQLALAAAMGHGRLLVHPKPRVVILSVGDELVNPGAKFFPDGSRFDANAHALTTAIAEAGGIPLRVGVVTDNRAELSEIIEDQLVRADLMITTGGLSEAASDSVKDVLAALGTVEFEDVAMAPGSRHGFGTVGDGVPIFALPGHPVAAQIAYELFVRPALRRIGGHLELFRPSVRAVLQKAVPGNPGVRSFVPAEVLGHPDQGYTVTILSDPRAPALADLARGNALAVVAENLQTVPLGATVTCMVLEG